MCRRTFLPSVAPECMTGFKWVCFAHFGGVYVLTHVNYYLNLSLFYVSVICLMRCYISLFC